MVRAILAGRKTQTRRIIKRQPPSSTVSVHRYHHPDPRPHFWAADGGSLLDWCQPCPYGTSGERLWVRETWQHANHQFGPYQDGTPVFFRADYDDDPHGFDGELSPREWRPSIHMPRSACRLVLEVAAVRVERLQDISDADAQAEGCDPWNDLAGVPNVTVGERAHGYRRAFYELWKQINGPESWRANPWVWVIEFRQTGTGKREK
jgi:hypothetical protein